MARGSGRRNRHIAKRARRRNNVGWLVLLLAILLMGSAPRAPARKKPSLARHEKIALLVAIVAMIAAVLQVVAVFYFSTRSP
jgi:hypothetical protein